MEPSLTIKICPKSCFMITPNLLFIQIIDHSLPITVRQMNIWQAIFELMRKGSEITEEAMYALALKYFFKLEKSAWNSINHRWCNNPDGRVVMANYVCKCGVTYVVDELQNYCA